MAPPFIPSQCQFATWPTVPHTQLPTIGFGHQGNTVGYCNGVLKCRFGQSGVDVWNPYKFLWAEWTAVRNVQAFFGLYIDGIVGPPTWNVIQWGANGFPT